MATDYENLLFNAIKDLLTVGGGAVGAGSGLLTAGTTSWPGAVAGAALGRGAGEGIHNLYRQQSKQPVDVNAPYKALPEGAAMEAGGQVAGKLIGKLLSNINPAGKVDKVPYQGITDKSGELKEFYHGSPERINFVDPTKIAEGQRGIPTKGGFYATDDPEQAANYGLLSLVKQYVKTIPEGQHADVLHNLPKPVINKFYLPADKPYLNLGPQGSKEEFRNFIKNAFGVETNPLKSLEDEYIQAIVNVANKKNLNSPGEAKTLIADALEKAGYSGIHGEINPGWSPQEMFTIGESVKNIVPASRVYTTPEKYATMADKVTKTEAVNSLIKKLSEVGGKQQLRLPKKNSNEN